MDTTKYLILRRSDAKSLDGKKKRGPQAMGGAAGGPLEISVEHATGRVAASLAREPEVAVITPAMPTRLIPFVTGKVAGGVADWGLEATGVTASRYDGAGVKIAVLDTGIDAEHPAFAGVTMVQEDFSGDGVGDVQGHGTHCAGTIFGRDVGQRIGVARGVTEAFIGKVLRDDGSGDSEMIFQGMQWALANRADVISMSLGFDFPGMVKRQVAENWPADLATSNALEAYRGNLRMFDAIMELARAKGGLGGGALVIAAAGNESRREQHPEWRIAASLPAAAEDVISVAAVGKYGDELSIARFSNSMATVSAPGVDITSAWPGGGLNTISGTSMACPLVAGIASLWWQKVAEGKVKATPSNVRAALIGSASQDALGGAFNEIDFGQGLVTAP